MADEATKPTATHLVILGDNRQSVVRVFLLPKSDGDEIFSKMGAAGSYSHLFSLGQIAPIDPRGSDNLYPVRLQASGQQMVVELKEIGWRPPYILFESIKQQCRTRWLGRDATEIRAEEFDLLHQIHEAAEDMARARFPQPNPGEPR